MPGKCPSSLPDPSRSLHLGQDQGWDAGMKRPLVWPRCTDLGFYFSSPFSSPFSSSLLSSPFLSSPHSQRLLQGLPCCAGLFAMSFWSCFFNQELASLGTGAGQQEYLEGCKEAFGMRSCCGAKRGKQREVALQTKPR